MAAEAHATIGALWWPERSERAVSPATRLWNVPLWLRLARQLRALGVSELYVAGPAEAPLGRLRPDVGDTCLVVGADFVLDPTVLEKLLSSRAPAVAVQQASGELVFAGAALLGKEDLVGLDLDRGIEVAERSLLEKVQRGDHEAVRLEALPDYRVELRRRIPVFAHRIATAADVDMAERLLLDATQKGTNDLPALYIHPPLENALVRLLVPMGVSANAVTAVVAAVALAAAVLFFYGHLMAGLLLAMAVGVLDGVDGKIARVKLESTELGAWLDHASDNVYEILWYLGWGYSLTRESGDLLYRQVGWAMSVLNLLDCVLLGSWKLLRHGDFHESSAWDRAFCRVCGRRNNIIYILFLATVAGRPEAGFLTALAWWAITLLVHSVRVPRALLLGIGPRRDFKRLR